MWAVKLSNGRGHVEWYRSLAVREQESDIADARHFTSKEEAEARADFCQRHADAFSGIFFDEGKGRYTLTATVEPVERQA